MAAFQLLPLLALAMTFSAAPRVGDVELIAPAPMVQQDSSIYVVYYWRARPGRSAGEDATPVAELRDLVRQEIWRNF
jgi:hypothetical protein